MFSVEDKYVSGKVFEVSFIIEVEHLCTTVKAQVKIIFIGI